MAFERIDVRGPKAPELSEPVIHFAKALGFQAVEAALCVNGGLDESGVTQHAKVFGDGGLRHPKLALDVSHGLLG